MSLASWTERRAPVNCSRAGREICILRLLPGIGLWLRWPVWGGPTTTKKEARCYRDVCGTLKNLSRRSLCFCELTACGPDPVIYSAWSFPHGNLSSQEQDIGTVTQEGRRCCQSGWCQGSYLMHKLFSGKSGRLGIEGEDISISGLDGKMSSLGDVECRIREPDAPCKINRRDSCRLRVCRRTQYDGTCPSHDAQSFPQPAVWESSLSSTWLREARVRHTNSRCFSKDTPRACGRRGTKALSLVQCFNCTNIIYQCR
ncbi:uncharacterized protein LOC121089833 isoform X1 [Falco naumanni]|uniref:uncharacterized protein LOC121089833 isoform X1 n=1 Tax=Falco naumanni TaxID=148594 RepID=UPI001ADDF611|nr:uncharacterized protein LOC121089833 isoform X1 [Falco naumanni]